MSDIEIVDVKINGKRRREDDSDLSPEEYVWRQLVDTITGTITLESLRAVSRENDMKKTDEDLKGAITQFSKDPQGMTKEEFIEIFKKCKLPINSSGQIVT